MLQTLDDAGKSTLNAYNALTKTNSMVFDDEETAKNGCKGLVGIV